MKTKNKNPRPVSALLLVCGVAIAVGRVNAATLQVGDPAPALQVSKWIQGSPVKEFQRDKAYIVEFWATWCGPCRASIPHLNEIHAKYKDKGLVVIGQDAWEQDPDAVAPFVKKMGDQMTYRVALDDKDGKMAKTWMEAAGEDGIPTAFVVDKRGMIAWIGHPMKLPESMLDQVLTGNFDVKKAAAEYKKQKELEEQKQALWKEFNSHRQQAEWDQAEAALAKFEQLLPEADRDDLGRTRFEFLLDRKDYKSAYRLASRLSDAHSGDAMMQNEIAWSIATRIGLAERDLDLAEKIARRANAAAKTDVEKAEIIDTLARVLFVKGQKSEAIALQKQAIGFVDPARKSQFQKRLADYEAGRVPNDEQVAELQQRVRLFIQRQDWPKAESSLAELEKLLPEDKRAALDAHRFRILSGRQDYEGATRLAGRMGDNPAVDPMMLNQLAWEIALRGGTGERDLALAEKLARRAQEVASSDTQKAEILDTLARVLFLKGQKNPAIELQAKAVELAKNRRKDQFQETLDSYRQGKVPKGY
jgi:thiol-disulfide isomerase/thioredoxin/tetratricopeptide (TPR) repeat protein